MLAENHGVPYLSKYMRQAEKNGKGLYVHIRYNMLKISGCRWEEFVKP